MTEPLDELPDIDSLPELTPEAKKLCDESDLCWEIALPKEGIPPDVWRVVSIRSHGRFSCRFSEWYASEDRVTTALQRIKSEGYELVSVTKYKQEPT